MRVKGVTAVFGCPIPHRKVADGKLVVIGKKGFDLAGSAAIVSGFLPRISGFLRITPSPEQGTSAITASNAVSYSGTKTRASSVRVSIISRPSRAAVPSIMGSFFSWISQARIFPRPRMSIAAAKLFPPGLAQASITRMPLSREAISTAVRAARSWM